MVSVGDFNARRKNLNGAKQFRIVPSRYPPIDLFELLVAPEELDILFEIESMTNESVCELEMRCYCWYN